MSVKKSQAEARTGTKVIKIDARLLRRRHLPEVDERDDKEARGRVLVIGGSFEMPGAIILAATAALRAGAGKLQIATARSVAQAVAVAVPEARVFALPETEDGTPGAGGLPLIAQYIAQARAVLVGPGVCGAREIGRFTKALIPYLTDATLVLDANALNVLADDPELLNPLNGRAVLTPHATEASEMLGESEGAIKADGAAAALRAAQKFGAVVALKGRETFVAAPCAEEVYCNVAGNVGLATSGSGDALAGLIAGLAARGAEPQWAAAWGVHVHALAGDRLARSVGALGFLARELVGEFPALLMRLGGR